MNNLNESFILELKKEILFFEEKHLEYLKDYQNNLHNRKEYWKGKSDAYKYTSIKLKRLLGFYEIS